MGDLRGQGQHHVPVRAGEDAGQRHLAAPSLPARGTPVAGPEQYPVVHHRHQPHVQQQHRQHAAVQELSG
ncbi:hypothetical protein G6F40_018263 [Rhizopus arrhizus]|nr:hypothetical protein G6F40_018263 [Rhizopus arrhizus]